MSSFWTARGVLHSSSDWQDAQRNDFWEDINSQNEIVLKPNSRSGHVSCTAVDLFSQPPKNIRLLLVKEKLQQIYSDSEVLFRDGPKEIYRYFALFSRCSQTFHEVISFLYSFVTKMQEGDYDAKTKEQTKVFTYTFFIDMWVMDTLCLVRDCWGLSLFEGL